MKLDKGNVTVVEYNIRPAMAKTISIPYIDDDNKYTYISVYVASSAFGPNVSNKKLIEIAKKIEFKE